MIFMFAIHKWGEPFSLKYLKFELTPNRKIPIGMFFMALSMIAYGFIEYLRKQTPIVQPVDISKGFSEPISEMSMYWQIIPSLLMAIGESFEWVGAQQWFYDEAPDCYKATMSALYMLTMTFAGLLSNVFLAALSSWIPNNLNDGHADLFMYVFAGVVGFGGFFGMYNVWAYNRSGGSYQKLVIQDGGSLFKDGSVDNSTRVNAHHHDGKNGSGRTSDSGSFKTEMVSVAADRR